MSNGDVTRTLMLCGAVEVAAWGIAWWSDWAMPALVLAVVVSLGAAGVIVAVQRRRQGDRKGGG